MTRREEVFKIPLNLPHLSTLSVILTPVIRVTVLVKSHVPGLASSVQRHYESSTRLVRVRSLKSTLS